MLSFDTHWRGEQEAGHLQDPCQGVLDVIDASKISAKPLPLSPHLLCFVSVDGEANQRHCLGYEANGPREDEDIPISFLRESPLYTLPFEGGITVDVRLLYAGRPNKQGGQRSIHRKVEVRGDNSRMVVSRAHSPAITYIYLLLRIGHNLIPPKVRIWPKK